MNVGPLNIRALLAPVSLVIIKIYKYIEYWLGKQVCNEQWYDYKTAKRVCISCGQQMERWLRRMSEKVFAIDTDSHTIHTTRIQAHFCACSSDANRTINAYTHIITYRIILRTSRSLAQTLNTWSRPLERASIFRSIRHHLPFANLRDRSMLQHAPIDLFSVHFAFFRSVGPLARARPLHRRRLSGTCICSESLGMATQLYWTAKLCVLAMMSAKSTRMKAKFATTDDAATAAASAAPFSGTLGNHQRKSQRRPTHDLSKLEFQSNLRAHPIHSPIKVALPRHPNRKSALSQYIALYI